MDHLASYGIGVAIGLALGGSFVGMLWGISRGHIVVDRSSREDGIRHWSTKL